MTTATEKIIRNAGIDPKTPVWNLGGSNLSLATLAIIADALEKHGSVLVQNCTVDPEAPTVKALGFKIVHGVGLNEFITSAVRLDG